ncbi:MAG: MgtC/SapB family protein [Anaerolineaceae bacterium]|jgi:putative Mg2+ transporter-C (MgtC) family protein
MITLEEILLRLLVASVLGGLIGYERERDAQPAGLRTHMILVMGSCLAMILSVNIGLEYGSDPTRIAAQVIPGVGFLGAGAIMRYGFNVKGLTTATSLWSMAIVGLAIGYGYYVVGIVATLLMLFMLTMVNFVENRFIRTNVVRNFIIDINDEPGIIREVRKTIQSFSQKPIKFSIQKSIKSQRMRLEFIATIPRGEKMESLLETITAIGGVRSIKIE